MTLSVYCQCTAAFTICATFFCTLANHRHMRVALQALSANKKHKGNVDKERGCYQAIQKYFEGKTSQAENDDDIFCRMIATEMWLEQSANVKHCGTGEQCCVEGDSCAGQTFQSRGRWFASRVVSVPLEVSE